MVEKHKMILQLAQDGIFPITKDIKGNRLSLPASNFDFPGTIQGEGKLNGIPSLFIRLSGCNLQCCWKTVSGGVSPCDTAYAAYQVQGSYSLSTEDIQAIVRQNRGLIQHIVITGGEPFLQAAQLKDLCDKLKQDSFHLSIETNATLYNEELAHDIDFFSLSPKLASSTTTTAFSQKYSQQRICIPTIQAFIDHVRLYKKDFQLKFVYACDDDITEIKCILAQLQNWKNEDILLMPLGGNVADLQLNTQKTLEYCIRNGWRYCDRLHISLFGDKRGV